MLAPTYRKGITRRNTNRLQLSYLGTKGQIAKHGDDLVGEGSATNGSTDDNVHPLLRVPLDFIIDGEELKAVSLRAQPDPR